LRDLVGDYVARYMGALGHRMVRGSLTTGKNN
jgi:hypothetical protein